MHTQASPSIELISATILYFLTCTCCIVLPYATSVDVSPTEEMKATAESRHGKSGYQGLFLKLDSLVSYETWEGVRKLSRYNLPSQHTLRKLQEQLLEPFLMVSCHLHCIYIYLRACVCTCVCVCVTVCSYQPLP